MGLRYLIAIPGNREEFPAALDTVLARLGLQSIDGDFCCRLYLNMPERWAQFAGGRGFIVGDLFGRSEASEMATAFGGRPAEAGDLNALVQNYWGGYVALRPSARGIELFRDPSGALPAYYVGRDEGWYVASDAPLLVEAGLYAPKIAWEEVAWFYYTNGLPGERTALAGVQQIIPGVATTLSSRAPRSRLLWSPWQHVGADDLGAEALRAATFRCVRAWQASYGRSEEHTSELQSLMRIS